MIVYLASGERNYDKQHLKPWTRPFWEIQIVTQGRIRLCLEDRVGAPVGEIMWVFPPGHAHAWRGDNHRSAEVLVFHFDDFPAPVSEWVLKKGYFELALTPAAIKELQEIHQRAEVESHKPSAISALIWQQLAIELCLLIARLGLPPTQDWSQNQPDTRVQQAMRLFINHLKDGWNVDQICQFMAVSPAHLRRLFHQVLQSSPREIFEELRLNRAKELIMTPGSKLEDVAQNCGYENGAILSRAFKRHYRISPSQWRKQTD
jgi:AraC family transcriptional regulator